MSFAYYKQLAHKSRINVIKRGCRNNPAQIEYDSLPLKYRQMYEAQHGDPHKCKVENSFKTRIHADADALAFFSRYTLENGDTLLTAKPEVVREYSVNAAVLNAIKETVASKKGYRRTMSVGQMWDRITETIHDQEITQDFPHSLPTNVTALRRKYNKYINEGYAGLIHAGFCNDNSRKVSVLIEKLIMSLYVLQNKPFGADVYDMYNLFITGKIEVYDKKTGELFNRAMFMRNGIPIELSQSTIWNYLNSNSNRAIVDSMRNDSLYNKRVHRPHHHRHNPYCSFSKVSMDDRDLPRKMHEGGRVKAYYAYDVTSGCVVGRSYSRSKDDALFLECLRNMFRIVKAHSFPMPAEVEVEHHIVNHFKEELDEMFSIVRWCGAGNSQEKHAEHGNRAKKYQVERKNHTDIGRWWAKSEAYITKSKREGADYVSKTYDYDRLVADDVADINEFNNALHRNQKKYPGMTRWQVLLDNINPDIAQPSDAMVYKCIGELTPTTVRNNQYIRVQYADYMLPNPQTVDKLQPNNYSVDAYWLPNSEGEIREVYIYQNGRYICKCGKIDEYNTARVEWTDADKQHYEHQAAYVAQFDKMVKDGKADLSKIGIMNTNAVAKAMEVEVQIIDTPTQHKALDNDDFIAQLTESFGNMGRSAHSDI